MTHLTLEQCQKLKELGFPQDSYWGYPRVSTPNPSVWSAMNLRHENIEYYACPTLDELIEWLKETEETFYGLIPRDKWVAICAGWELSPSHNYEGNTAIEAVYNLAVAIKS